MSTVFVIWIFSFWEQYLCACNFIFEFVLCCQQRFVFQCFGVISRTILRKQNHAERAQSECAVHNTSSSAQLNSLALALSSGPYWCGFIKYSLPRKALSPTRCTRFWSWVQSALILKQARSVLPLLCADYLRMRPNDSLIDGSELSHHAVTRTAWLGLAVPHNYYSHSARYWWFSLLLSCEAYNSQAKGVWLRLS